MSRMGIIEVPRREGNGNGTPEPGEQTGRQRSGSPIGWGGVWGGQGFDGATTGVSFILKQGAAGDANASGLEDSLLPILWSNFPPTYNTYRLMRHQPTIAIARANIFSAILAAQWMLEYPDPSNKPPDEVINATKAKILPLRRPLVKEALRSIDFGHQKFERIWSFVGGIWEYERFKPLAPDRNIFLADDRGNFVGIRPASAKRDQSQDLIGLKAWRFTNDGEAGDPLGGELIGSSRLENVRETAWLPWLDVLLKSERLRNKVSGIIPIFYHPPGGFEAEPGNPSSYVTYQAACQVAARQLQRGDFVTVEHMGFSRADLVQNPDLKKLSEIIIEFYDAKDSSAALTGLRSDAEYYDRNMMRGMHEPERSALEARSGTRADAEQHTETSVADKENWSDEFDEAFNREPFDDWLALNWGEAMRGRVRVKTQPLVNTKTAIFKEIITAMISKVPALAIAFAKLLDAREMFAGLDCPLTNADLRAEIDAAIQQTQAAKAASNPQAGSQNEGDGNQPPDEENPETADGANE